MSEPVKLSDLPIGTEFTTEFGQKGKLLYKNNCRALVEIDLGTKVSDFKTSAGKVVHLETKKKKQESWAPEAPVTPRKTA